MPFPSIAARLAPFRVLSILASSLSPAGVGRAEPEAAADSADAARLEFQMVVIESLYTAGDYDGALRETRARLDEWTESRGSGSAEWCAMYGNLGPILMAKGDLTEAEVASRGALDCTRRLYGEDSDDLASVLNNYGSLLGQLSDFARAELALEESLRRLRASLGDDHVYVAITLNNLAIVQQDLGDDAAAERTLREAVARLETSIGADHPTTATARNNLGRLLAERGDFEEAEPLLRESLRVRRERLGDDRRDTRISQRDLGRLLRLRGDPHAAFREFRAALAGFVALADSGVTDTPDIAMAHHELARALIDLDRTEDARAELEAALAMRERLFEEGHPTLALTRRELASVHVTSGDLAGARELLARAAESFELGRENTGEGLTRATFLDTPWLPLAAVEAELDHDPAAWAAFDRAHARVLLERLAPGATAPNLEDVRAMLGPHEAIVGWLDVDFDHESRAWVVVVRADGLRFARLSVESRERIVRFREALASPGPLGALRDAAQAIAADRLGPVAGLLEDVTHLIVVPSGAMLGVPVGALRDESGAWLADRFEISYAVSGGAHALSLAAPPRREGPALLLGDPPLATSSTPPADTPLPADVVRGAARGKPEAIAALPPLPGARAEIERIASLWPGSTVLVGDAASEDRLVSLAAGDSLRAYRALHFAAHALVDADDAEASTLVLAQTGLPAPLDVLSSGARLTDGLVTAGEIESDWRLDADLVTLSACDSALGREVVGEGYVGFAHAFLGAGSRAVLATLWSVPDRATGELMASFYRRWRNDGASRVAALASAQSELRATVDASGRRPFEHPYYWASFVLIGDPR
ncbi:MAG: CHAT domain-containing tetratricopeptide repeat protein [bacterium]